MYLPVFHHRGWHLLQEFFAAVYCFLQFLPILDFKRFSIPSTSEQIRPGFLCYGKPAGTGWLSSSYFCNLWMNYQKGIRELHPFSFHLGLEKSFFVCRFLGVQATVSKFWVSSDLWQQPSTPQWDGQKVWIKHNHPGHTLGISRYNPALHDSLLRSPQRFAVFIWDKEKQHQSPVPLPLGLT